MIDRTLPFPCGAGLSYVEKNYPSPVGGRWRVATDEGLSASSHSTIMQIFRCGQALIRPSGTFPQRGKGDFILYMIDRLDHSKLCRA
jgi:hypothetical protein